MDEFIGCLKLVKGWRTPALVTQRPMDQAELARGYYFQQWAADRRNRDKRMFLKSLRNRAPFSEVMPDQSTRVEVEYRHGGQRVEGLGAAHLMEGLAVSLPLGEREEPGAWDNSWIEISAGILAETDEGDLDWQEDQVSVRHGSRAPHFVAHEQWGRAAGLDAVDTAAELWRERADFFPHLQFLPRMEEDLDLLQRPWFVQVRGLLARLEKSVAAWDPAEYPMPLWQGARITPEHEQRKRLCHFRDVDGELRCFDLHGRFTPGAGRLHFRLVPDEKALRVAYAGPKLT